MGGRVYDYNVGRFLSVDPFVHGTGSQGINPYSYILNNPLAGTDPSGYTPSGLTCPVGNGMECTDFPPDKPKKKGRDGREGKGGGWATAYARPDLSNGYIWSKDSKSENSDATEIESQSERARNDKLPEFENNTEMIEYFEEKFGATFVRPSEDGATGIFEVDMSGKRDGIQPLSNEVVYIHHKILEGSGLDPTSLPNRMPGNWKKELKELRTKVGINESISAVYTITFSRELVTIGHRNGSINRFEVNFFTGRKVKGSEQIKFSINDPNRSYIRRKYVSHSRKLELTVVAQQYSDRYTAQAVSKILRK
jgi:hypothetical protein